MEITLEKLIAAGNDLNSILKLEPPINATFTTDLKGGAAKAVEAKFVRGLQTEIAQLAEYQDKETGKFDLQPGDLPLLQPETLEVIFEISPKAKERLAPPQEKVKVAEKKVKKEKSSLPSPSTRKTRMDSFVAAVVQLKDEITIDEFALAVNNDYISAGGQDNLKQSRHLIDVMMPCAIAFGKIKRDGKKISKI